MGREGRRGGGGGKGEVDSTNKQQSRHLSAKVYK